MLRKKQDNCSISFDESGEISNENVKNKGHDE